MVRYGNLAPSNFVDKAIYSWKTSSAQESQRYITDRELYEMIHEPAEYISNEFHTLCKDILKLDNVTCVISGNGVEIEGVDKLFSDKFGKPVSIYYPESTLGARNSKWTVDLGMMYIYSDLCAVYGKKGSSVNMADYLAFIAKSSSKEERPRGITANFKKIFSGN